jgi:hypothetical protein
MMADISDVAVISGRLARRSGATLTCIGGV